MTPNQITSRNGSLDLPPEILVEIFWQCLPPDSIRLSTPPQLLPPFTLSQVCSFWRYLVHSSPRLWNRIVLGRHGTDSARESSALDFWLNRAGSRTVPLDIILVPQEENTLQVILNEKVNDKYERDTIALMQKFCANVHRLRTLDLDVLDATVLEPVFATLGTSDPIPTATAPLLEELELTTTQLGSASDARILHKIALTCPRLRSVSLMCPTLLPAPTGTPGATVLQNMRVLRLRFCTAVSYALDWIDVCPNLEYLKVQLLCRTSEDEEDPQIDEFDGLGANDESDGIENEGWVVVNHPRQRRLGIAAVSGKDVRCLAHLTRLALHSFSLPAAIGTLLDSLHTPALRSLKLSSSVPRSGPRNARWLHVPLLLQRSDPPLEDLEIAGVPMNVDDVRASLMLAPQLKRFSIGMFEELNELLEELIITRSEHADGVASEQSTPNHDNALLCPKLEVLVVADASFSVDTLARIVSSRFAIDPQVASEFDGVAHLKELCVDATVAPRVTGHPVIAECISQGLKLSQLEPNILMSLRVD